MPSVMDWKQLMSRKRFRGGTRDPEEDNTGDVRSPFIKDADRIIYCSAFRRLQDKTQVHPFPETDYIRTRLTHSLEVSSVGRALGMAVGRYVIDKYALADADPQIDRSDFGAVVAAACLTHDIGNPPFGHAGEHAIREWFSYDGKRLLEGAALNDTETADLQGFEGNAQGLRILTRLQAWRENGGLQLSCATLGAFMKYPWGSKDLRESVPNSLQGKFGYFEHDRESCRTIAETLGMLECPNQKGRYCRHPLAFLVEAADDICYLVVDIEDGFKANKIPFEKGERLLKTIAEGDLGQYHLLSTDPDKIAYLRAKAIGVLVGQVNKVFWENDEEIQRGTFVGALLDHVPSKDTLGEIREVCNKELFKDPRKLETEAAGFEVIRGLLEIYTETLESWEESGRDLERMRPRERTIIQMMPDFDRLPATRYQWLLRVTDYVSGMTDSFAVRLYRKLKGVTIGLDIV